LTSYLLALSGIVTTFLFFSSQTEPSRIVTIQRPMVITQERKTPAYFVYQQTQRLQVENSAPAMTAKAIANRLPTTYLSNLSLSPSPAKLLVAEMKFNKREFLAAPDAEFFQSVVFSAQTPERAPATKSEKKYSTAMAMQNLQISAAAKPALANKLENKWATIRGKFELIEGVGVVDHIIELKRIEEGQVREVGYIDLKAGLYSIDIESPRGQLVAEIKDRNGFIIGEDREPLINLQSRGSFYEGPFLRLGQPAGLATNPIFTNATAGTKIAGAREKSSEKSSTRATIFDNQNALEKPEDTFTNISGYSSTISRFFDPRAKYKNITSIRHTGDKTETSLFTKKWTDGVVSYISDIQKIEFKSKNGPLIIGRVLQNGKPVLNAEVQIATAPGLLPIYFDQFMIPAFNQTSTSENAYFMFVGLEPDNYQVIAFKQNIILGSQMFIAEEDAVAFQNIASQSIPRIKVVRSFDAFAGVATSVDVAHAESPEVLEISDEGTASLKTFSQMGLSEFLVRSPDRQYLPIRYIQNALQDYVHLPMIQEQWLTAAKEYKKITGLAAGLTASLTVSLTESPPETGIIIGFSKNLNFDVYLAADNYNKNDIVYFNSAGNIVEEPNVGGGFVLFNVPVGAREVIVQERLTDRIYAQFFNVLSQQVSVAHFGGE